MVVTSRSLSRSRSQERVQDCWCDLLRQRDLLLSQIAIQQVERIRFCIEPATKRPLVSQESLDAFSEKAVEGIIGGFHNTSSPSPHATSRSASTSTLL